MGLKYVDKPMWCLKGKGLIFSLVFLSLVHEQHDRCYCSATSVWRFRKYKNSGSLDNPADEKLVCCPRGADLLRLEFFSAGKKKFYSAPLAPRALLGAAPAAY